MKKYILYTAKAICKKYEISNTVLSDMVSWTIANPSGCDADKWLFSQGDYDRIACALRFNKDLDINIPGAAMAIDLLDELGQIKHTLRYRNSTQ